MLLASRKDKNVMHKPISAKWIILLTVLINAVATSIIVMIFPSIQMAKANMAIGCIVDKVPDKFPAFNNDNGDGTSTYNGNMYSETGGGDGNKIIATMTITFTGNAPTGNDVSDSSDNSRGRGSLTDIDFSATAQDNPFNFQDMSGSSLDTSNNKNAFLSDFTVNLDQGGEIHFIGGAFVDNIHIAGMFVISGGPNNNASGAWVVK
jgi:hypothetical protein